MSAATAPATQFRSVDTTRLARPVIIEKQAGSWLRLQIGFPHDGGAQCYLRPEQLAELIATLKEMGSY